MNMNQPPSTVHHRSIALATTLYRWPLVIYPASFRQRYGASMLQVFRDSCRTADRAAGRRGLVAFWLPTLADLFKTALAEWLMVMRLLVRPVTLRVCGLLTLLSALGALLLFVLPSLLWELGLPTYFAWPRGREWFERSELLWDALVLCCFLFGMCGVLLVQRTRSGRVIRKPDVAWVARPDWVGCSLPLAVLLAESGTLFAAWRWGPLTDSSRADRLWCPPVQASSVRFLEQPPAAVGSMPGAGSGGDHH